MGAQQDCDVAIVGGGPAGAAAAIVLAREGRTVRLVERSNYDAWRIGETLPPHARPILEELGIAEQLGADGHLPAPGLVVAWGSDEPRVNDFILNPYGDGWHVDRARFDRMLALHAQETGVALHTQTAVTTCTPRADGWQLDVRSPAGPAVIRCRLVIDAAGRRATPIKRLAGGRTVHDRLVGIAAIADADTNSDHRTLVESTPQGWWYTTPLPQSRRASVFMTDADTLGPARTDLLVFMRRQLHDAPLTAKLGDDIGRCGKSAVFAAMTYRHAHVHGRNWLLAGDAAMARDPLSGQGICKALESGMRAARAAHRALGNDAAGLADYSRWCDAQFSAYLANRRNYYRLEQRWPDTPFWRRRHTVN